MVLYLTAATLDQGYHDRNVVQHLTAATLDQGNHDRNSWISTLLQHPWTKKIIIETLDLVPYCSIPRSRSKEIMIETLGSVPYCSNPRSWKSLCKPLVQYLTAASLDQENHDRNPWF
jgi:hypothetical protein